MDDLDFLEVTLYSIGYEIVFDKNQNNWAVFYSQKKAQPLARGFDSRQEAIIYACNDAALFLAVVGKLNFKIWQVVTINRKAEFINLLQSEFKDSGDAFGPGSGPSGRTPCGVSSGQAA